MPGFARRRRGSGFQYLDPDGRPVGDPETLERIRDLAIPPAWRDVWICPFDNGHLQAVGIDAAGRTQYLYHRRWRERRDQAKFEHMVEFGRALPGIRATTAENLALQGFPRERVLACAVRLLDIGFFRIGSEDYTELHGTYGLATMLKRHVDIDGDMVTFDYPAKGGKRRIQSVVDPTVVKVIAGLKRRRGGGPELLAFKRGNRWRDLRSDDINDYIKDVAADEFTAKDFRTWSATVLAAAALALSADGTSKTGRPAADHVGGGEGRGVAPGEHAHRVPQLLHRPARVRPLSGRRHHPRRAREGHLHPRHRPPRDPTDGRIGCARSAGGGRQRPSHGLNIGPSLRHTPRGPAPRPGLSVLVCGAAIREWCRSHRAGQARRTRRPCS
jgi:DNA topoisomerase IB